jgi:hypothetical protein
MLIGGYHFYPEAAAAAAVPWLFRHIRPGGPEPGSPRAAFLGLVIGGLPWLHPKFVPLAVALGLLLVIRLRSGRLALIFAAAGAVLPLLGLLLFDRQVTGLLRPDAFYRRYGDEVYTGPAALVSSTMPTGLVNAVFAARDGVVVMAPILALGLIALPLLWRRDSATAWRLAAVFASLWVAAAVHSGGAAGPPGRLLSPVAVLLAAPLAAGLVALRAYLPFRWTAVALALVTSAISLAMLRDFRRVVNPYRGVFASADVNFAQDLPDAVRGPEHLSAFSRAARDLGRGLVLAAAAGFWAWRFARVRPGGEEDGAEAWRRIRDLHLGWWATIAVASVVLHALGAGASAQVGDRGAHQAALPREQPAPAEPRHERGRGEGERDMEVRHRVESRRSISTCSKDRRRCGWRRSSSCTCWPWSCSRAPGGEPRPASGWPAWWRATSRSIS